MRKIFACILIFSLIIVKFDSVASNQNGEYDVLRKDITISTANTWVGSDFESVITVPLDSFVKYEDKHTARISFNSNEPGSIAMIFIDREKAKMKNSENTGYLSIPIKGNGVVDNLNITLQSGDWNIDPDVSTEQLATVNISGITQDWQVKDITMSQFVSSNNAIDLDDIRSIQVRDVTGGMVGSTFWIGYMTFHGGFNPETTVPRRNWVVNVSTYSTWCYGDIVKAAGDTMPVDTAVKYSDNGFTFNTGRLEFTSNNQGTARFLGFPDVRLASSVNSAYIEIPIKGNGISDRIELSMVSNNGTAGSWAIITGVTNEWQIKRIYINDFFTYMGVPNFDNINWIDFYALNSQGAKFWLGNFSFHTSDEHPIPLEYTIDIPQAVTWAHGEIDKNFIPVDNSIRHNGRPTARIKFLNDSSSSYALLFTDPQAIGMAEFTGSGYLNIPIKGNGISERLEITLASGVWHSDPNLNTERTAKVTIQGLSNNWQTKKITMQEFINANPEINLDDIRSVRFSGTQEGYNQAVFWVGDLSFVSKDDNKSFVRITPNDDILLNPGMGWILLDTALPGFHDLGISGQYPLVQNVGVMTTWGHLEPSDGVYTFDLVDETIDYWTSIGKNIHFRISTDDFPYYGNRLPGCPDWLYDLGVPYQDFIYPDEQIPLKYPDLNNLTYQTYLNRFMNVFGERYRNHPDVTVVGLRGYGLWGEWHSGYAFDNWEDRKSGLRAVIDAWVDGFQGKKHLSLNYSHSPFNNTKDGRYPQGLQEFMEYNALDYALNFEEIGFEREGAYGAIQYPQWEFNELTFNMGKMQIAEIAGSYAGDLKDRHLADGIDHSKLALEECLNLRPNYITIFGWDKEGNARLFYDERKDLIEYGLKNMGYRLYPDTSFYDSTVRKGEILNISQEWKNLAMGRFFEEGYVKISIVDLSGNEVVSRLVTEFDLVDITKEESKILDTSLSIPTDVEEGLYNIKVSIVNSEDESIVEMPMDDMDSKGRYYIGGVNIFSDGTPIVEDPTSEEPDSTTEPTAKEPGDSSKLGLILILFVMSVGSVLTVKIKRIQGDI